MNLKKTGKVFTSKFVGTGPLSYKKRIYRAAVSRSLRNTELQNPCFCLGFEPQTVHPLSQYEADQLAVRRWKDSSGYVGSGQRTELALRQAPRQ